MIEPPIVGMKAVPWGCDEGPLMAGAFVGCVRFALGEPELRQQFKDETGQDITALVTGSPIDRMIDEATGHDRAVFAAFADWVSVNLWGDGTEPDA